MRFFEDVIQQVTKSGYRVCGDHVMCYRTVEVTYLVVADGIGSGVYANIAAITCAEQLMGLFKSSIQFKTGCEMVADSMHRAKIEDAPYAAFTCVKLSSDGSYAIFSYEAPEPILITGGFAKVLDLRFYKAKYDYVGEAYGHLSRGDAVMVFSDGVGQAGMGNGMGMGIGSEGVVKWLDKQKTMGTPDPDFREILKNLTKMTAEISGGTHADDTTAVILKCREARDLIIATGPPSSKQKDNEFVNRLIGAWGKKVICGSTTTDVIAKVMGAKVTSVRSDDPNSPPEYLIDGIDLVAEGAMTLSQACNIIDEPLERLSGSGVVERFCRMMRESDIITFMMGAAMNAAHGDLLFKQLGVRPRRESVETLAERLTNMGKVVIIENY
ncbi:MAG: SpoIIE family protein phosphatase [Oscillospiraceae bacterium]|nr:SpoIIE family protein phosphatase [Oscillospiraceae bacterium]